MSEIKNKFSPVIEALLNNDQPFPARFLRSFSDLAPNHLHNLRKIWPDVKTERKVALLEDLENVAESDTLVDFDEFAKFTLLDNDPAVRILSIRLLWECEEARLIPIFTELMLSDPSEDVRAAAASALGKFVLLGELEALPDNMRKSNMQNLLEVAAGEDLPLVRRHSLESLGYSSDKKVVDLIENALLQNDNQWLISALFAIGRSADERWSPTVMKYLESEENEILFEAIRAAGELELDEARDVLLEKLDEEMDDPEIRYATIWSLSQIGGESVKKKLELLAEKTTDEEELDWLEKALDNMELGGESSGMEMIEFDADEKNVNDEEDEFFETNELDEDEFEN